MRDLLANSCGLQECEVDIREGYAHQQGTTGPRYAYAHVRTAHPEDDAMVVSRISQQVMQGTRVKRKKA